MENPRSFASPLSVEPAGAWDILFLLAEVSVGTAGGHFSRECGSGRGQLSLALRCCRAILGRKRSPGAGAEAAYFFAARLAGATVGAVFASAAVDGDGQRTVVLEYAVVDGRCRRAGVGEALVRHLLQLGPRVECWCTPNSTTMERLLRRLRFRRVEKASVHELDGKVVIVPALWRWLEPAASGAARYRRLIAAAAARREREAERRAGG